MKALFILDSLSRGGAEMYALDVCRKAAANGLEIGIAAGTGDLEEEFRNSGAAFYPFRRRLPIDPAVVLKLRGLIRREGYDILHAHQPVDGVHAFLAAIGTPAKCVLTYHGHFPDSKNRLAARFLAPRVAANISCSQGLLPWLQEQGLDTSDFQIVYNGVDRERLTYSGPDLRDELKLESDALLFGMVAHFYPAERKDQLTLCRAFADVARDLANSHLIIVGRVIPGAEEKFEQCMAVVREAGITDRVHFLGQRNDLAKIMTSLDVYVLSSFHEGLPIALMEAMLAEKPTILSDIPPHLEVSHDGEYALTFRTGDAAELAAQMRSLALDTEERLRIASKAYDFAVRTFSIETHIAKLKELYAELLH